MKTTGKKKKIKRNFLTLPPPLRHSAETSPSTSPPDTGREGTHNNRGRAHQQQVPRSPLRVWMFAQGCELQTIGRERGSASLQRSPEAGSSHTQRMGTALSHPPDAAELSGLLAPGCTQPGKHQSQPLPPTWVRKGGQKDWAVCLHHWSDGGFHILSLHL